MKSNCNGSDSASSEEAKGLRCCGSDTPCAGGLLMFKLEKANQNTNTRFNRWLKKGNPRFYSLPRARFYSTYGTGVGGFCPPPQRDDDDDDDGVLDPWPDDVNATTAY